MTRISPAGLAGALIPGAGAAARMTGEETASVHGKVRRRASARTASPPFAHLKETTHALAPTRKPGRNHARKAHHFRDRFPEEPLRSYEGGDGRHARRAFPQPGRVLRRAAGTFRRADRPDRGAGGRGTVGAFGVAPPSPFPPSAGPFPLPEGRGRIRSDTSIPLPFGEREGAVVRRRKGEGAFRVR